MLLSRKRFLSHQSNFALVTIFLDQIFNHVNFVISLLRLVDLKLSDATALGNSFRIEAPRNLQYSVKFLWVEADRVFNAEESSSKEQTVLPAETDTFHVALPYERTAPSVLSKW